MRGQHILLHKAKQRFCARLANGCDCIIYTSEKPTDREWEWMRERVRDVCNILYITSSYNTAYTYTYILPMSFVLIWLRCYFGRQQIKGDTCAQYTSHTALFRFRFRTVQKIVEACHERIFSRFKYYRVLFVFHCSLENCNNFWKWYAATNLVDYVDYTRWI